MKTIGLLGGMSWESTESYYRAINKGVKQRLGGLHSAKIALISVDFQKLRRCNTVATGIKPRIFWLRVLCLCNVPARILC